MSSPRLGLSLPSRLALAVLALVAARSEASTLILTWGDSITYGAFDGTNANNLCTNGVPANDAPETCGYPGRLGSRLNDLNRYSPSYEVQMLNLGKEGEKTPQALTRARVFVGVEPTCPCTDLEVPCPINSLAYWYCEGAIQPGDLFVLMEGTNDVTQQNVSNETIQTNLVNLAAKAEWLGMNIVISTLTPRHPEGWIDSGVKCADSGETDVLAVNQLISAAATAHSWPKVDAHFVLDDTTGTFNNYYQGWDPMRCEGGVYQGSGDPVGHPNREGFDEMAYAEDKPANYPKSFESVVRRALPPRMELTSPSSPFISGISKQFSLAICDDNATCQPATLAQSYEITWDFGDGKVEVQTVSSSPVVRNHTFWNAGNFTVTITAEHANGGQRVESSPLLHVTLGTMVFADDFESGGTSNWTPGS